MNRLTGISPLFLLLTLVACTNTPHKRFPDFYTSESQVPKIDIVIDTIVLSDLAGSGIGFNKRKNLKAQRLVQKAVIAEFKRRGYQPNILFTADGAYYQLSEKFDYYLSSKFKSLEKQYLGYTPDESTIDWSSDSVKHFVNRLSAYAPSAAVRRKHSLNERKHHTAPITPDEIPQLISSLNSDRLVFIKAYSSDVYKGSDVGIGLFTGVLSAALTGGTFGYTGSPISGSTIEIITYNKAKRTIEWHNSIPSVGYNKMDQCFKTAFQMYPTVNGNILSSRNTSERRSNRKLRQQEDIQSRTMNN